MPARDGPIGLAKSCLVFDAFHSNPRRELERNRSNSLDWLVVVEARREPRSGSLGTQRVWAHGPSSAIQTRLEGLSRAGCTRLHTMWSDFRLTPYWVVLGR